MVGPEDLLNAGEVAEVDGVAWTFSHITPSIRGQFSAWLKGRARQGLAEERREGSLGPEEYREQSAILNAEFAAGAYSWGSPLAPDGMGSAVQTALEEVDGKVRLVQLLLGNRSTRSCAVPKSVRRSARVWTQTGSAR
jgi:hypothetical protein